MTAGGCYALSTQSGRVGELRTLIYQGTGVFVHGNHEYSIAALRVSPE